MVQKFYPLFIISIFYVYAIIVLIRLIKQGVDLTLDLKKTYLTGRPGKKEKQPVSNKKNRTYEPRQNLIGG